MSSLGPSMGALPTAKICSSSPLSCYNIYKPNSLAFSPSPLEGEGWVGGTKVYCVCVTKESIIDKTYRHSRESGNPGKKTGFLVKPGMTKQGECLYNYGLISNIIFLTIVELIYIDVSIFVNTNLFQDSRLPVMNEPMKMREVSPDV